MKSWQLAVGRWHRWAAVPAVMLALIGCGPKGPQPSSSSSPTASHSPSAISFAEVAKSAGISWSRSNGAFGQKWMPETMGGGGGFIDYDNDGRLDIVLVNGDWWPGKPHTSVRPTLAIYHNEGDGTFKDVTAQLGLNVPLQGMGVAVGDFDNDGWDDLLITTVTGSRLFHNEGGKRFTDVTAATGVGGSGWCTSAAWLDYDNDGKLDLFICHYVKWSPQTDQFCGGKVKTYCTPVFYPGDSCHLYHNEGGGKFKDVTRIAGLWNDGAKALGVVAQDIDGDGKVDLIVANDQVPNLVYKNLGNGKFEDISLESGLAVNGEGHARAGMGIDAADVNNDGALSVIIGNFALEGVALHVKRADGTFSDVSRQSGVQQPSYPFVTFGALWCDFDNDGWMDAFVTNGHVDDLVETTTPNVKYAEPNVLFANQRDGTFQDASSQAGPGVSIPMVGRAAACGDFDNDGKLDLLLVPNIGAPRLLKNTTLSTDHWINLKLVGTKSNRNGYGARVTVKVGGTSHTEWVRGGGSYLSQSDLRLHVGLGSAGKADEIVVHWPSGQVDTWKDVAPDKRYRVTEGKPPELLK